MEGRKRNCSVKGVFVGDVRVEGVVVATAAATRELTHALRRGEDACVRSSGAERVRHLRTALKWSPTTKDDERKRPGVYGTIELISNHPLERRREKTSDVFLFSLFFIPPEVDF